MRRSVLGLRFTYVVTGLLLAIPVQMFGKNSKSRQEMPVVRVSLYNYSQIPSNGLALARRTAAHIIKQAGIRIVWSDVPVSGEQETALRQAGRQLGPADLRVRVLSESKVPVWAKKTHQVAFSLLPGNGALGTTTSIYSDRVHKIARREDRPMGLALGCVIVHEMGHLLLRMKGHGRSGIMSFPVTGQYLSQASLGRLAFTTAQAKRLQREV